MAKKDAAKALPRLRFPEFVGEAAWEYAPLATVCTVLQGYGFPESLQGKENGKYPFCKVSDISRAVAENGSMLGEAANYIDDAELAELRARIVPKGATVFAKIGEALKLNRRAFVQRPCLIDNNVVGIKAIDGEANDYFIYLLSQQIDLNEHCGGAVPSVNKSTLEAIKISIPGYAEQAIIANCLSSLDELIVAQGRKVEVLKAHKRGLMQVLFPREGETTPRLRFPEFRDGPEWENATIGSRSKSYSGGTPKTTNRSYYGGNIPFIRSAEIAKETTELFLTNDGLENSAAKLVKSGDVLVALYGANSGDVAIARVNGAINQAILCIEPQGDHAFLYHYLTQRKAWIISTYIQGGQGNLSGEIIKSIILCFPSNDEQQRIASCLSSLDSLIAKETEKLESLKIHKKGLMQGLFPATEEIS